MTDPPEFLAYILYTPPSLGSMEFIERQLYGLMMTTLSESIGFPLWYQEIAGSGSPLTTTEKSTLSPTTTDVSDGKPWMTGPAG